MTLSVVFVYVGLPPPAKKGVRKRAREYMNIHFYFFFFFGGERVVSMYYTYKEREREKKN